MPLYEYSCEKCSRKVELLIRGDEKPECPHCHSTKLTKLLSVVSGHVAGDGGNSAAAEGCGRPQCGMGGCAGLSRGLKVLPTGIEQTECSPRKT
ncbi:MAG: FmdB family zinc ribbon protein [Planctomycetia bacterium]